MPTSKSSGSSSMLSASSSTSRSSVSGSKHRVVKERGRLRRPLISTVSKRKKTGCEQIQVPGMQRFGEWVMCVLLIDGY
jgi:hypothetical protein